MSLLLDLQKITAGVAWPQNVANPPSGINRRPIRADGFRSGSSTVRGEGHDCFPRHRRAIWMDGRYKKDGWKHGYSPPSAAPVQPGLFGCHHRISETQLRHIFRRRGLFLILRGARPHIGRACLPSQTAIIISIDGFSVPPSISFPNYTVERSAVANNQINAFGYLDSIIAPPSLRNTHNNPLFGGMSVD